MAKTRASWWMYLAAATFLATICVYLYVDFHGVEPAGTSFAPAGGRMIIATVSNDGPFANAGIRAGDALLTWEGQTIQSMGDWIAVRSNLAPETTYKFEIERAGQRMSLPVHFGRVHPSQWPAARLFTVFSIRLAELCMWALACLILFSRPKDKNAWLAAGVLASVSITNIVPPYGTSAILRALPLPVSLLIFTAAQAIIFCAALLITFLSRFPRPMIRTRALMVFAWVPAAVIWVLAMLYFTPMVFFPQHITGLPASGTWFLQGVAIWTASLVVLGIGAMVLNYRRLDDLNEKRRVRVVVFGMIVSWSVAIPTMIAMYFDVRFLRRVMATAFFDFAITPLFLAFPLSMAYAVLRHKLFDIRIIIRQGLQYAVARGTMLYAVPAIAAVLVLDLLLHGNQPLIEVLKTRGWTYGVLIGLALLAHKQRESWMAALDKRFFRERYDAQRLLRDTVEEIRSAGSLDAVAPRVVARIEAVLHPEFVALLVRESGQADYRALVSVPAGMAALQVAAESKLMSLFRVLGKPLQLAGSDSSWLAEQLPHDETQFLRDSHIELLIPVVVAHGGREAMLVLGARKSEEPYSREDQDLLLAMANAMALLLERPAIAAVHTLSFGMCPSCSVCYDAPQSTCATDGRPLTPMPFPRHLAGRYRLLRLLGKGGMGSVFEAQDTALERAVAVKLMREDLLVSREAMERFRAEARAAASFSHPNVVAIHDFGAEGTRAFLVMEMLHGSSLRKEIEARALRGEDVLAVMHGIAAAVDAAHRRQIVHRDLKPDNVYLVREGGALVPKVLDFGLAKCLAPTDDRTVDTAAGALLGTPRYMSPEQLRGGAPAPGWDLWALAIIAYEILCGSHPFANATPLDMASGRFTPAPEPHLQGFFVRTLAAEPAQRPQSAADLVALFRESVEKRSATQA